MIKKWKVFTPRANNIGTELADDNFNTIIGKPNSVCTEAYILIGEGLDLDEKKCENLCKYFKTQFARYMHSLAKASHDATSKTYSYIPLQDFSDESDINWTDSISGIDEQLYDKYKLDIPEIEFIKKMIKPMV